jgi:hypothetical protein
MNRAAKIGIAGTCTALLVLGGIGTYNVVQALSSGTADGGDPKAAHGFDPAASHRRTPRPSS